MKVELCTKEDDRGYKDGGKHVVTMLGTGNEREDDMMNKEEVNQD